MRKIGPRPHATPFTEKPSKATPVAVSNPTCIPRLVGPTAHATTRIDTARGREEGASGRLFGVGVSSVTLGPPRGSRSFQTSAPSYYEIHRPTTPHVHPRLAKVPEDRGVVAPGVF